MPEGGVLAEGNEEQKAGEYRVPFTFPVNLSGDIYGQLDMNSRLHPYYVVDFYELRQLPSSHRKF